LLGETDVTLPPDEHFFLAAITDVDEKGNQLRGL
jgi:hypothetical protein